MHNRPSRRAMRRPLYLLLRWDVPPQHVRGVLRVRPTAFSLLRPTRGFYIGVNRTTSRCSKCGRRFVDEEGFIVLTGRNRHRQDDAEPHDPRAVRSHHLHRADSESLPDGRGTASRSALSFGVATRSAVRTGRLASASKHVLIRTLHVAGAAAWQRGADHRRSAASLS